MVLVHARQLNLPRSSLSSPQISSLLFDPISLSLALMHSDSSFSLYPFSLSSPSLPSPQTLIPSPTSSATFLRLHKPDRLLFLVSSPYLGGASVLLRFWILMKNQTFSKAQVSCNHRDLKFDRNKSGVVFSINHGVSVKLIGSINVFAMYSVSNRKVWIFAVKLEGDGVDIKLMKCAVVDCSLPVFSISVSFGFLILGEDNGVRVFPLRPLVKGKSKKHHRQVNTTSANCLLENDKLVSLKLKLPNGKIREIGGGDVLNGNLGTHSNSGGSKIMNAEKNVQHSNGRLEEKMEVHSDSAKLRSVKLKQDSREGGGHFVTFNWEVESSNSTKKTVKSVKAISIQALSLNKFLILDSIGGVHILSLSNTVLGLEVSCHMKKLSLTMQVQNLAVLPDVSPRAQTFWISDGHHTVHTMEISDMDSSVSESDKKDNEDKQMEISVIQAIFAGEKIQELVPLAANAILILGQGSIFVYAIS